MRFSLLSVILLFCAQVANASSSSWVESIKPRDAIDLNPDPDIVEVVIVAHESKWRFGRKGKRSHVWSYNGGIPGPTINGKIGDTLIVHFHNLLPESSTIHWHGLELPANMDGSSIAQNPVPTGGYFRYEFKLLRASTFWYHPHIRGNRAVERGLYGGLVVRDPQQDHELGLPENESLIFLDDILLGENNVIADPFPSDPLQNAITQVNGREGNTMLINGKAGARGFLPENVPHRLRLVNSSNSRFMRVSIPNHRLWRIGGDAGLLEAPIEVLPIGMVHDMPHGGMHSGMMSGGAMGDGEHDGEMEMPMMISDPDLTKGILLTPGERADVVFTPNGRDLKLEWHDVARGRHSASYAEDGSIALGHAHDDGKRQPEKMLRIRTYNRSHKHTERVEYIPPPMLATIEPIDATTAPVMPVMFGHTPPDTNGDVTFFVQMKNGMPLPFSMVTPEDAPTALPGDLRVIEVNNMTAGMHNFHLHGFMFQHIETQYIDMDTPENNRTVPAERLENKDTIILPARTGARGRSRSVTRLALLIDDRGREGQIAAYGKVPTETTSGGWLFHCHILEHSARGMTSFLQVLD